MENTEATNYKPLDMFEVGNYQMTEVYQKPTNDREMWGIDIYGKLMHPTRRNKYAWLLGFSCSDKEATEALVARWKADPELFNAYVRGDVDSEGNPLWKKN